jgi:hypothetical protein
LEGQLEEQSIILTTQFFNVKESLTKLVGTDAEQLEKSNRDGYEE